MGFLDRFRREGEPLPQLEPDDPRVAELADELDRAGGVTFDWRLLWSGPLLGDGDAATEAVTLLRKRWWHFNGEAKLIEIDEESALELLAWLFGYSLAYESELMPPERAAMLAANLTALVPPPRRWFTNGSKWPTGWSHGYGSTPATDFTFDLGVVAVADRRAWIAWFTDED